MYTILWFPLIMWPVLIEHWRLYGCILLKKKNMGVCMPMYFIYARPNPSFEVKNIVQHTRLSGIDISCFASRFKSYCKICIIKMMAILLIFIPGIVKASCFFKYRDIQLKVWSMSSWVCPTIRNPSSIYNMAHINIIVYFACL